MAEKPIEQMTDAEIDAEISKLEGGDISSVSAAESLARGFGQGATFGTSDEITAFVKSKLSGENFNDVLDDERLKLEVAKRANPKSFVGADIGGSIVSSIIPGAIAVKGTRALSLGAKAVSRAALFSAEGGAQAAGRASQNEDRIQEAVKGGFLGLLSGAALGPAAAVLKSGGKAALRGIQKSNRMIQKAIDGSMGEGLKREAIITTKEIEALAAKGVKPEQYDFLRSKVLSKFDDKVADEAVKNPAVKAQLVDMAKAGDNIKKTGKAIGKFIQSQNPTIGQIQRQSIGGGFMSKIPLVSSAIQAGVAGGRGVAASLTAAPATSGALPGTLFGTGNQ